MVKTIKDRLSSIESQRLRRRLALFSFVGFITCTSCLCQNSSKQQASKSVADFSLTYELDKQKSLEDLKEIAKAPHPLGSARQMEVRDWLVNRVKEVGATAQLQEFKAETPNPEAIGKDAGPIALTIEKTGFNILSLVEIGQDKDCVVAIGSHYDSKVIPGINYLGANDSGSSSVALIQIIQSLLSTEKSLFLKCHILAIWFDGEEPVLQNWDDGERRHPAKIQDNTYGSRYFVKQLESCSYGTKEAYCFAHEGKKLAFLGLVLMDMIGSPDIKITRDSFSSRYLISLLDEAASKMNKPDIVNTYTSAISDDHIPFRNIGIPAVNIIDFNNLQFWHKEGDEVSNVSQDSIETASKLALYISLSIAADPKAYFINADN